MPANDALKQYLDAGLEFTELTRKRAEKIVTDLVKAGEVQREHTQQRVDELIERSRKASLMFADAVRKEVTRQLTDLGLVPTAKKAPTAVTPAASAPSKTGSAVKAAAKKTTGSAKAAVNKTTSAATARAKKTSGSVTKTAKKAAPAAKKATGS